MKSLKTKILNIKEHVYSGQKIKNVIFFVFFIRIQLTGAVATYLVIILQLQGQS